MPAFTVGTIDYGSDNKANLLAAINAQNGTTYTLAEYGFTEPKRVTIANPLFNTSVKLGPRAATGKIGFKTIYYNRIHISEIGVLKITYQNEMFLTELLSRLSEKYGIPLSTEDIFEQRIIAPVAPETEVSITLAFKESSLAYYGGASIVLGNNDPASEFEDPATMPFKNKLVFYVNDFNKTGNGDNYLKSSILSIADDGVRSRTMTVTDKETTPYAAILKNTYSNENRAKLEQYLPFVFTWTFGDTKIIRGINIYGEIFEMNETSNDIIKISSIVDFDPLVPANITEARSKIYVREGARGKFGSIFLLVGNPTYNRVDMLRSDDEGLNFNLVSVDKTRMATFDYGNWENVVIHDMMVIDEVVHVLVTNPIPYGVNGSKALTGPAVERFDLNIGESDYFPLLNQGSVINPSLVLAFNPYSKLRFVSIEDENSSLGVDVVGVVRTALTNETVVAYFHRPSGQEYVPEILNVRNLDYPVYGLSAYSKPMLKDPTAIFVSVEILTIVPVAEKDDYFLVNTNLRAEDSYLGYGVVTASTIRKGLTRNTWSVNSLELGGGSRPTAVTVSQNSKRNHYVFSGGNGIYKTKYSEISENVYASALDKVYGVGSHLGFNLECDIGNGDYVTPSVQEDETFTASFFDYPEEELSKPFIGFSFIAKNKSTEQDVWLTSPNTATSLTERVFGSEYGFLGDVPVAVFSDSTGKIYAWTKNQGIYVSSNQGRSWSDYSVVKSYYASVDYLGQALVPFKASDIKALSISGAITYAEVKVERSLLGFNTLYNANVYPLELSDSVVYRFDSAKPAGDVSLNTPFLTTGLNSTSYFSPRKVIGWDTDSTNNIRALSEYTEAGVTERLNQVDIPNLLADTAIAVYSDVGFLGLKAVVITHSGVAGVGYRLHTVSDTDVVVSKGLKDSTAPVFSSFEPVAIQPLWDGNNNGLGYTPVIVTSTGKDILVLERDGLGGAALTVNSISLVIPGDNANPMQWFSMLSSNRRDRYVFQEDNGIFKLVYSYNSGTSKSVITLLKVFDTSSLDIETVYTGCQHNLPNITPFSETTIDPYPALNTVLGNDCLGFNERNKLADGFGSYYWKVTKANSSLCGYVEPVQVTNPDYIDMLQDSFQ